MEQSTRFICSTVDDSWVLVEENRVTWWDEWGVWKKKKTVMPKLFPSIMYAQRCLKQDKTKAFKATHRGIHVKAKKIEINFEVVK